MYLKISKISRNFLCYSKHSPKMVKLITFVQITTYTIVGSQLIFYLMVMADALKMVSLKNFIAQRKAVDSIFHKRYHPVYYSALLFSGIAAAATLYKADPISTTLQCIAFLCLVADITIALKKNAPINKFVNTYSHDDKEHDWETTRRQWLKYIEIRGIFISIGMLSLIVDLVW